MTQYDPRSPQNDPQYNAQAPQYPQYNAQYPQYPQYGTQDPQARQYPQYNAQYPQYPQQTVQPPYEDPKVTERRARRKSVGEAFLYFGIYLMVQVIASSALSLVLVMRQILSGDGLNIIQLMAEINSRAVLFTGITNLVTLLVFIIIFCARRQSFFTQTHLTRVRPLSLLIIPPLAAAAYAFVASALSLLPESILSAYTETSGSLLGGTDLMQILCIVLIAPVTEEILFRGLIYARLKRGMPALLAALLAALLFGVMHGQPVWIAYASLLALLFICILNWYGSILPCILLHVCFNAAEYVLPALFADASTASVLACAAPLLIALILLARQLGRWSCNRCPNTL